MDSFDALASLWRPPASPGPKRLAVGFFKHYDIDGPNENVVVIKQNGA